MATDTEYRVALDRLRLALASSPLPGAAIRVGLWMIRYVNYERFLSDGIAGTFVGIDRLARESGLSRRGAQLGRNRLERVGAIVLEREGGHGEGDTDHYTFNLAWAGSVEAKVKDGARRALKSPKANRRSLYPKTPREASREVPGRTTVPEKGEQVFPTRANHRSPESLDVNPSSETIDGEKVASQDGAVRKAEGYQQPSRPAVSVRGIQEKRHLDWPDARDRVRRLYGNAVNEELADTILLEAVGEEISQITERGTSEDQLRSIFSNCRMRMRSAAQ